MGRASPRSAFKRNPRFRHPVHVIKDYLVPTWQGGTGRRHGGQSGSEARFNIGSLPDAAHRYPCSQARG